MAETKDPEDGKKQEQDGAATASTESKLRKVEEEAGISESRVKGDSDIREKVERAVKAPYYRSLVSLLANSLVARGQTQRPELKELEDLINSNLITKDLDDTQIAIFQERLELQELINGQGGRDIRREILAFERFQEYGHPDMISAKFLGEREQTAKFLDRLFLSATSAADMGETPLDPQLKDLSQNPEKFYEKVLMESITVCARAFADDKRSTATYLPKFFRDGGVIDFETSAGDQLAVLSERKSRLSDKGPISKPVSKWIPLVTQTFRHAPKALGRAILDSLGCIPEELFTKKVFSEITFAELAKFHNDVLRSAQESPEELAGVGDEFHKQRVLHARTQLITHLFLSGKAEPLKAQNLDQLIIDVNGLWINIAEPHEPGGKVKATRINAHIPFPYISEELCKYLEEHEWIKEDDALEIRLQRAVANNDLVKVSEYEAAKTRKFAMELALRHRQSFSFEEYMDATTAKEGAKPECPSWEYAEISAVIGGSPAYIPQVILYSGHRLPESAVRYYLQHFGNEYYDSDEGREQHYRTKVAELLRIAEAIESVIAEEAQLGRGRVGMPRQPYEEMQVAKSYELSKTAKETYKIRQRILNDARYYDVAKLLGIILQEGVPANSAKAEYLVFRGKFGKGGEHQFLEIVQDARGLRGNLTRVLLAPNKHLTKNQKERLEAIPELGREEYERLEAFAMVHKNFKEKIIYLSLMVRRRLEARDSQKIEELMKEINAVILTESPNGYVYANTLYKVISTIIQTQGLTQDLEANFDRYIAFCETMLLQYAQKLFGHADPAKAIKALSVDIQREEVVFDEAFFDSVPERKEKPWVCDKDLSTCGRRIKVVYADKEKIIPYAMEEKAINALGLLKDRPLINIAGGCRETGYLEGETPSIRMGRRILKAADKFKANVAPPGTQSGFGADMSKVWLEYQDHTEHLPETEKAKVFAVSPGGETFYPGNPFRSKDEQKSEYAIATMDSILTPYDAGWSWSGPLREGDEFIDQEFVVNPTWPIGQIRKAHAPYFHHVEYMEAIYQRLAGEQKRVMVIGNGGLFTIVEANAALKNNVPIIITKDTGRFADLVVAVSEHLDQALLDNPNEHREKLDQAMLDIIENHVPQEYRNSLYKDFGRQVPAEKPEQELYRINLYEYLIRSKNKKIKISTIEELSNSIDTVLTKA